MAKGGWSLLEEGWIPCELLDGNRRELSLRDCLLHAERIRAIADPSPLVTAAIHRLLLAVLHRVFGPATIQDWKRLYQAQKFDSDALGSYLQRWESRFDLFHPERPFYQVRGLPFEPDGVSRLVLERSNYGAPVHVFEHRVEGHSNTLTAAEAVRNLLALHVFAPGGLVRKPNEPTSAEAGPLNRGALVLLVGATLHETLVANLLCYDLAHGLPIHGEDSRDLPAWEDEATVIEMRPARGWLDLLTWQSRRLELVRDLEGQVTGIVYCVGREFAEGVSVLDPMVAYRRDDKSGLVPIGFEIDRVVWRDSHVLVRAGVTTTSSIQRPKCLEQLAKPELRSIVPQERRFSLELLGMRGDRAKILLSRAERLPVSPRLLADELAGDAIEGALRAAEESVSALRKATWLLAEKALSRGSRMPDRNDVDQLNKHLGAPRAAWGDMSPGFMRFLGEVSERTDDARKDFKRAAEDAVQRAFRSAAEALGSSSRALQAGAIGESALRARLHELSDVTEVQSS